MYNKVELADWLHSTKGSTKPVKELMIQKVMITEEPHLHFQCTQHTLTHLRTMKDQGA